MPRLNDTNAIADSPSSRDENYSVSKRRVDNGFIVCESSYDEHTGQRKYSEKFYRESPKIVPPRVSRGNSPDSAGGLADTMKYLNNGR